jgi:hypothetical protein
MVGEPLAAAAADPGQSVVYARVSSADQKPDLDQQVARVTEWATGQGRAVGRVVIEVGSALNGARGRNGRCSLTPGLPGRAQLGTGQGHGGAGSAGRRANTSVRRVVWYWTGTSTPHATSPR